MATITKFDLEQSVEDTESLQNMLVENKYAGDNEHNWEDVKQRLINIIKTQGSDEIQKGDLHRRCAYTPDQLNSMIEMIEKSHFIPGGSILSGTATKGEGNKSSLSNCYVLQIAHDSLEGICDFIKEACRTYSYRGGVGVDLTILRPDGTTVHNAAKTSTGAISFMPMISTANQTIGQCITEGTRIKTKRGLIPIEEVDAEQDEVWTRIGWVKVTKSIASEKEVYELTTVHGNTIKGSLDHQFQTLNTSGVPIEKPLQDFKVGDSIVLITGDKTENLSVDYLPLIHSELENPVLNEDLAYVLGYLYNNSYYIRNIATNQPISISVSCATAQSAVFKVFTDLVDKLFRKGHTVVKEDDSTINILIGDRELIDYLEINHLFKERNDTIEIPELIFRSPSSVQMAFIHGYSNALGLESGQPFTFPSKAFALGFQLLLSSNGIVSRLTTKENPDNLLTIYELQIIPDTEVDRLTSTGNKYLYLSKVADIVKVGTCKTYDLQLPIEHLFFANGIYTHNCGRRSACMISIDCRHPDVEQFIWSKADPHSVFSVTKMSHDISAVSLQRLLAKHPDLPSDVLTELNNIAWTGKVPDVNTANISVKFNDEFMKRVELQDSAPWICLFPDIEANKELYETEWNGDYEKWIEKGGTLKEYDRHYLYVTDKNYHRFIGRKFFFQDNGREVLKEMTKESLLDLLKKNNNYYRATIQNPSPYQIFLDLAMAAWMRGDPGVLFWDKHLTWTTFTHIHERLKPMTTNPCFSGDTKVLVADGRGPVSLSQLVLEGKDVPVYTRNSKTGELIIKMGRMPRVTRNNAAMLRIHFDNNAYIDVTEDHKFPLSNGQTTQAKDLKIGDVFYALTRKVTEAGEVLRSNLTCSVKEIEKLAEQTSYNITIDDTHQMYVMTECGQEDNQHFVLSWNCGEENLFPYSSCLLGAQVFSSYVKNPWKDNAEIDWKEFVKGCYNGALLMQFFSDINEDRHPLKKQCEMEKFAKRIGVEFTGFADMLSMIGIDYGSNEAIELAKKIAAIKNYMEFCCSIDIAKQLGPCEACDPNKNTDGLKNMMEQPYFESAMKGYDFIREILGDEFTQFLSMTSKGAYGVHIYSPYELKMNILETGLRNVAFNTVGPTGSVSIVAGNCSSGIEPVFALFYTRYTRVGDRDHYNVCHAPIAKFLLKNWEALGYDDKTELDSSNIKKRYHIVEAHELDYHQRIKMQLAMQLYCDSSISSTVNLPESSKPEDIVNIYLEAWQAGLKGITIFRTGSLNSVLEVKEDDDEEKSSDSVTENTSAELSELEEQNAAVEQVITDLAQTYSANRKWGEVIEIDDKIQSFTHTVHWRGAKFYVIVSTDSNKRPVQMFISSLPRAVAINEKGEFNNESYHNQLSNWTALMRMISITLRAGVDPKIVVKQLRKSSFTMLDMMSIVARVLDEYTGAHEQTEEELQAGMTECPECHKKSLRHEGGCATCQECGYSRCG